MGELLHVSSSPQDVYKRQGYICIEDNKPEGIAKLQELVEGEANIEVQPLKTKYPQGAERMLIYAVTGETINSSMLPADAGCIVDNVDTVVSVSYTHLDVYKRQGITAGASTPNNIIEEVQKHVRIKF